MTTLLSIEVSPRGECSVSRRLTGEFIAAWESEYPGNQVIRRDLMKTRLPFVDLPWIGGAFTPAETHSPEMAEALTIGNELIAELVAADHIVIGTPMYNFAGPAALKAYIDQVVRVGVTFGISPESQFEGLLKGKKATVILSSGSDFTPGSPFSEMDGASPYLRRILGWTGITETDLVYAGPTRPVDTGQTTLAEFAATHRPGLLTIARASSSGH